MKEQCHLYDNCFTLLPLWTLILQRVAVAGFISTWSNVRHCVDIYKPTQNHTPTMRMQFCWTFLRTLTVQPINQHEILRQRVKNIMTWHVMLPWPSKSDEGCSCFELCTTLTREGLIQSNSTFVVVLATDNVKVRTLERAVCHTIHRLSDELPLGWNSWSTSSSATCLKSNGTKYQQK